MKGKYQKSRGMFGSCYRPPGATAHVEQTKLGASLFPVDKSDRYKTA